MILKLLVSFERFQIVRLENIVSLACVGAVTCC